MKRTNILIYILLISLWLLPMEITAQTPYDSFAPEATRPMICTPAERWMQKVLSDSVTYTLAVDVQNRTLYLINEQTDSLEAIVHVDQNNVMWLSVDPLADKYIDASPYVYCIGNPIRLIDPNGMDWYDQGDGTIIWDDNATSQEAMNQVGIKGLYLGKNVLVAKHGRDENLNEEINGAMFELYLETYRDGPIATIRGNTIPCDVEKYGTLREGRYPAIYQEYHGMPAILINFGGDLPTIRGNPNNPQNYIDYDKKIMKPLTEHIMNEIFFHYGNHFFQGLKDSKGNPWTIGCQTGGNYKDSWIDYKEFMQNVPTTFSGWYYLRSK